MSTLPTEQSLSLSHPVHKAAVSRRLGTLLPRLGVIAMTLVICLAMLEVGLRVTGRYPLNSIDGYHAEEDLSYGLAKNVTTRIFWPTHSWLVRTDALGLRANANGPRDLAAKPYYAVLGSSDAFGNGLDYDKTFIGVFSEKMAAHGIEVANLAVGGHHLLEQVGRFKGFRKRVAAAPRAVIIVFNPLLMAGFDDVNPNVVVRRGELFNKDNWRLPLAKMILSKASAAYCFFRDGIRNTQLRFFSRQDFPLDFYIQAYSTRLKIRTPAVTAEFERHLTDLEAYIRGQGATPICVYSPATGGFLLDRLRKEGSLDRADFDTQFFRELARRHCASAGIQFVDIEPLLQERYDAGQKLNFDLDAHFNEPTSQAVGEYLYRALNP